MYPNVHCNTICNSQDLKNLDVHWQMNKEIVVHIYNEKLLTHKKEHIWVRSNEMDELEPIIQSEESQKDKYQILLIYIWNLEK